MEKNLVFKAGTNPVSTDKIKVFEDNSILFADTSSANGLEVLQFIKTYLEEIDYAEQYTLVKKRHVISSDDFKPNNQQELNVQMTFKDWLSKSGIGSTDLKYSYHKYLEIKVENNQLSFGNISINNLLQVAEKTDRYFYSLPFYKQMIEDYGADKKVIFEYTSKDKVLSIGFKVEGTSDFFNISYNPPNGNVEKK